MDVFMKLGYISSCILIVFALVSCDHQTELEKVQDEVMTTLTAFYDGDVDTYINNVDFGTELNVDKDSVLRLVLQRYLGEVQRKGGILSIEPLSAELTDDSTALVKYSLNYNNGDSETCIRHIRKQDGEWRIAVSLCN